MIVKYVDFGGDSQEATGSEFQELYLAGKVPPDQTVLANGEPWEVMKLLEVIEDVQEETLLKGIRKAKLEEEQFQKTAPWWLKRYARFLINWAAVLSVPCIWIYGWKVFILFVIVPYLAYMSSGGVRYDGVCDMVFKNQYDFAIQGIERKRKRRLKEYRRPKRG